MKKLFFTTLVIIFLATTLIGCTGTGDAVKVPAGTLLNAEITAFFPNHCTVQKDTPVIIEDTFENSQGVWWYISTPNCSGWWAK